MALSTDYAAAQLSYFKLATTVLADNRLAIQTHRHEIVRKLCAEPISQSDLLWMVNFGLWNLIDIRNKPVEMSPRQFDSLLAVQNVWLKILEHHGNSLKHVTPGVITLAQLF